MPQHDYTIEDGTGVDFLANLNALALALATWNSGAGGPATTYPFMIWVDTSGAAPVIRQRNAANSAWVTLSAALLEAELVRVGALSRGAPVAMNADFTVAATENWLINSKAGSACVVTLPAPASALGREIMLVNGVAQTVVSASANVVPLNGAAAGTAILPAIVGATATLVSNGAAWRVVQFDAKTAFGAGLVAAADAAAVNALLGGRGAPDFVLEDRKANGTSGQWNGSNGIWYTRDLNTEVRDPGSIVTLASNQFTVTVDCWVEWAAPGGGGYQTRLWNVTDSLLVTQGTSELAGSVMTKSLGGAAVAAGKTYRIEQNNSLLGAQGSAASRGGGEVYTRVLGWRV